MPLVIDAGITCTKMSLIKIVLGILTIIDEMLKKIRPDRMVPIMEMNILFMFLLENV